VAARRLRDGELDSSRRSVELDFRNRKPYVVAEKGSLEDANPGHKAEWFRNARDAIKARFPGLRRSSTSTRTNHRRGRQLEPRYLLLLRARRIPNPRQDSCFNARLNEPFRPSLRARVGYDSPRRAAESSRSGGRLQAIPERAQDRTARNPPRNAHSPLVSEPPALQPSFGIVEQPLERGHECRHVSGGHDDHIDAVGDDPTCARAVGDDDRESACHRFDDDESTCVVDRRQYEDVRSAHELRNVPVDAGAMPPHAVRSALEHFGADERPDEVELDGSVPEPLGGVKEDANALPM
jgi:hypothetical protein